jgi:hypothetical protein
MFMLASFYFIRRISVAFVLEGKNTERSNDGEKPFLTDLPISEAASSIGKGFGPVIRIKRSKRGALSSW